MDPNNPEEYERKKRAAGICCFNLLGLTSLAAFICSVYSTTPCNFVARSVTLNADYMVSEGLEQSDLTEACRSLGYGSVAFPSSICQTLLQPHAIGFQFWQGTVPVDQKVCFSYTQLTPFGYVSPNLDTNFIASQWMSVIGIVFGGLGCFTVTFANCCRIDQARLQATACNFFIGCLFTGLSLIMFRSSACAPGFFAPYFVAPDQLNNETKIEEFNSVVENVQCSLSTGSNLAIAATVLYFVCACMVPASVVPVYANQQAYMEQQQQEQQQQGGPTVVQGQNVDPSP